MADTLKFSLVSPERELFSGDVAQVDMPGTEGRLGVLPGHAPVMAALSTGLVTIFEGGTEQSFFVQGGFADVTPSGLTVLAERAMGMDDLNADELRAQITAAEEKMQTAEGEAGLALSRDLDGMKQVLEANFG
jgi:F-type H+-transporting ATPase subunit epsilon